MANAAQVRALIESHSSGDDERFYSVALQLAAQANRAGQSRFAKQIMELIENSERVGKHNRSSAPTPLDTPRGDLADILMVSYPDTKIRDLYLDPTLLSSLTRIFEEQSRREYLRHRGFSPIRKVLLVGPPGTGKTMTASAIAGELRIPLFSVQLHGLISRYLGETASQLRLVFDAMLERRGVYFFDEIDALGADRGASNDVGEIRRVLNSFLQFIELDRSDSVIVGATNYRSMLDRALFRRFDSVLYYNLPGPELRLVTLESRLAGLDTSNLVWGDLVDAADGLSQAELLAACDHVAKTAILGESLVVDGIELKTLLLARDRSD